MTAQPKRWAKIGTRAEPHEAKRRGRNVDNRRQRRMRRLSLRVRGDA